MGKYLDASGVSHLWTKAKQTFALIDHNHDASYAALGHNHDASYAAKTHAHGNITNDGKISGVTAASAVITTADGTITTGSISNDMLANKKVTIAGNEVNLGGSLDASTLRDSLGITTAMYWAGVTTSAIDADASKSSSIVVGGKSVNVTEGAVAQKSGSNKEYIYSGATSGWQEIGDESSYALKTNTVNGLALSSNPNLFSTDGSTAAVGHVLVLADTTNHKYMDSGYTIAKSVPSDAKFTDTVYTHPTAGSGSATGEGTTTTDVTGSSKAQTVITGFNIDASGHVSSVNKTKIYSTDTVYTHPSKPSTGSDASAADGSSATSAVVSVQIDASGHVSGVKTKTFATIDTVTRATATATTGDEVGSIKTGTDASVVFKNGMVALTNDEIDAAINAAD